LFLGFHPASPRPDGVPSWQTTRPPGVNQAAILVAITGGGRCLRAGVAGGVRVGVWFPGDRAVRLRLLAHPEEPAQVGKSAEFYLTIHPGKTYDVSHAILLNCPA